MAHATTSLAYSKDYVFALRPIYTIYYYCCYSFVSHISCFALSFYLTSHSFLPDLFPYIRLDCIFLCAIQFSSQFYAMKTKISIRCFYMFFSLSDIYLVMTILGIYKYISFIL